MTDFEERLRGGELLLGGGVGIGVPDVNLMMGKINCFKIVISKMIRINMIGGKISKSAIRINNDEIELIRIKLVFNKLSSKGKIVTNKSRIDEAKSNRNGNSDETEKDESANDRGTDAFNRSNWKEMEVFKIFVEDGALTNIKREEGEEEKNEIDETDEDEPKSKGAGEKNKDRVSELEGKVDVNEEGEFGDKEAGENNDNDKSVADKKIAEGGKKVFRRFGELPAFSDSCAEVGGGFFAENFEDEEETDGKIDKDEKD